MTVGWHCGFHFLSGSHPNPSPLLLVLREEAVRSIPVAAKATGIHDSIGLDEKIDDEQRDTRGANIFLLMGLIMEVQRMGPSKKVT
jgi:hypothetical protein